MSNDAAKQTSGKSRLLDYLNKLHPATEILIDDLKPGARHELPPGFSATNNPLSLTIGYDPSRFMLYGPVGDWGATLPLHEKHDGRLFIRALDLASAAMTLLRVGPPTWTRNPMAMMDYVVAQISQCDEFDAPAPEPRTREENERHIASCSVCQPVAEAMARAIDAGASLYSDAHVAELVSRAHENQVQAIEYYERKRLACTPVAAPKPARRTKATTPAEVAS